MQQEGWRGNKRQRPRFEKIQEGIESIGEVGGGELWRLRNGVETTTDDESAGEPGCGKGWKS